MGLVAVGDFDVRPCSVLADLFRDEKSGCDGDVSPRQMVSRVTRTLVGVSGTLHCADAAILGSAPVA